MVEGAESQSKKSQSDAQSQMLIENGQQVRNSSINMTQFSHQPYGDAALSQAMLSARNSIAQD
jgi:hypothetical protein